MNTSIADRKNVFYWQTDRAIEPEEAGVIWADRHRYFTDAEVLEQVNKFLTGEKLVSLEPFDSGAQTNLGNVNSVRVGTVTSGKEVVIRCHPKGVANGYFHAEALAAATAQKAGLPSFESLLVHDYEGGEDFAFHVIEKLPGTAIKVWLESHPDDEANQLIEIGKMMAQLHQTKVDGFGPFDNTKAMAGSLVGLHTSLVEAVNASLAFNLTVLVSENIISATQKDQVTKLLVDNPLLEQPQAVLVHNDFADWNLLTDGRSITGILDWDECVAGSPIGDIACWSTFFEPSRLEKFLEGYWQVAEKPPHFQETFELLRLRYVVSKMTLRIRRYSWEKSEFIKEKIETGKTHLVNSMGYFGI
ncbi:MAG: aminoglycoside phosphotransferase family protein [bacterium]|nr:aminoglycoside phosphotransferase family protein [bacterium]